MPAIQQPDSRLSQAAGERPAARRLAYIVHSMQAGGLEKCVADLVNHLDPERWQPLVVCLTSSGPAADWIRRPDVPVIELHKRAGNDWGLVRRLARTLRQWNVSLAHSHNWGTLLETSLACGRSRAAHVHAEHGLELNGLRLRGIRSGLRRWARQWAFRRADAVVAVADSVRQRIDRQWGFPADRVHWIPNGVGAPPVQQAAAARRCLREQLQVPADRLLLGSVGRLAPVKDFGTAIAALADLNRRGTPADLLLVGDGPERERLEEQARRHQVERQVHFLGYRRDVGDCLTACDIYVNSSLGEAMSLSILEAMALGLPVVATNVGDNARLVAGPPACGRIVPSDQPAALADELARLAADRGLRDALGQNARRRHADCFSIQSMVDGYDSLYAQVCAARGRQVRR